MSQSASLRQLDSAAREFAVVRQRFGALLTQLDAESWLARPVASQWSVGDCIAHLNLTSEAMVPRVRAAFEEAKKLPPLGTRAYASSTLGWILARTVGPAPRVLGIPLGRVRTPTAFEPLSRQPMNETVTAFRRWRDDEEALLREAAGLPIDRVRIESPFRERAFYDGWSSLLILARHELRHLVQAERVVDALAATRPGGSAA